MDCVALLVYEQRGECGVTAVDKVTESSLHARTRLLDCVQVECACGVLTDVDEPLLLLRQLHRSFDLILVVTTITE